MFEMIGEILRSPKWLRDEILLVAEVGIKLGWPSSCPERELSRVAELLAGGLMHGDGVELGSKFRNVNGVGRKYSDLYSVRPSYVGKPTNGGKATAGIAALAEQDPQLVTYLAEDVRRMLATRSYRRKDLSYLSFD